MPRAVLKILVIQDRFYLRNKLWLVFQGFCTWPVLSWLGGVCMCAPTSQTSAWPPAGAEAHLTLAGRVGKSRGSAQKKQKGDSLIHSHDMGTCCHQHKCEGDGKKTAGSLLQV